MQGICCVYVSYMFCICRVYVSYMWGSPIIVNSELSLRECPEVSCQSFVKSRTNPEGIPKNSYRFIRNEHFVFFLMEMSRLLACIGKKNIIFAESFNQYR
jgi:hypothetical protein